MATSLTTPGGDIVDEPTGEQLAAALDALLAGDDAEADLWLEDDEGWTLSVVATGDVFWEHLEQGDDYQTLGPLPRDEILRLLQLLAEGNVAALEAEPWEQGE